MEMERERERENDAMMLKDIFLDWVRKLHVSGSVKVKLLGQDQRIQ